MPVASNVIFTAMEEMDGLTCHIMLLKLSLMDLQMRRNFLVICLKEKRSSLIIFLVMVKYAEFFVFPLEYGMFLLVK